MPQIAINDMSMNYYDNENMHRPALVFIHGLSENLSSWSYQLKAFNSDYRVIAMDLRGHGLSSDGSADVTMDQLAGDVLALLDALHIEQAHFVGLSMGGMICQELSKHHQDIMLSIALCNTSAFPTDQNNNFANEIYSHTLNMFKFHTVIPYIAATAAAFAVDYRNILGEIKVPTLVIVGEYDMVTPVWAAEYLHKHIKNSELVIIPGASHFTKLEAPVVFNQVLRHFLQHFTI